MRKVIFKCFLSPGDIVMLTAAVRDLHKTHPNKFITGVQTSADSLWEHNPYISRLANDDTPECVSCTYPLIQRSNTGPWHFIHGFIRSLSEKLGVAIDPSDFRGDIHIADIEKSWINQVQEVTVAPVPFWIISAGGKFDFTAKWWPTERYQQVVDHFEGRILFVQVGEKGHHHPRLSGTFNLVGKTDLRQMIRLMYHSQGVLCPVTMHMHLAAAVPVPSWMPRNRPCVVVAGGREPAQWEAYPHHQYLHTTGALACCEQGGCWKSRVVPLGDSDRLDSLACLCMDVVHIRDPNMSYKRSKLADVPYHALPGHPARQLTAYLPRCLDLVTVADVIRAIELYFLGGVVKYLNSNEATLVQNVLREVNRG